MKTLTSFIFAIVAVLGLVACDAAIVDLTIDSGEVKSTVDAGVAGTDTITCPFVEVTPVEVATVDAGTPGTDTTCHLEVATTTSKGSVTVQYQTFLQRTLNVQTTSKKSDIGGFWNPGSVSSSGTTLVQELGQLAFPENKCLYVRLNVSEGSPASSWLCEGNGSTALIDPDAKVTIELFGKFYDRSNLSTWSAPGGTAAGCSALFILALSNVDCSL